MYALIDENYNTVKEFADYNEAVREMAIHNALNRSEWDIVEIKIEDQE
jgi:hypothetical protein